MGIHTGVQALYDTELHCLVCGARLYVPDGGVVALLDSLKRAGIAGLLCTCGEVHIIDRNFQLLQPKPQK